LVRLTEKIWLQELPNWIRRDRIQLYEETLQILTRAVCTWVGVPLSPSELKKRTELLRAMFEDAGAPGLKHFHSRRARKDAETWIINIVNKVRSGELEVNPNSPLATVCYHRDEDGQLLSERVAA